MINKCPKHKMDYATLYYENKIDIQGHIEYNDNFCIKCRHDEWKRNARKT